MSDKAQYAAIGAYLGVQNGDDWIQTASGKAFYPLRPRPDDICLTDIAHALGNLCRYGGQCRAFYSVAEHSVLLSYAVPPELAQWALMHDASEAYLIDIPKPLKPFLPQYLDAERRLMELIAARYGLEWPEPETLHEYDTRILHNEQAALHPHPPRPWNIPGQPLAGITITGWPPLMARTRFLGRCQELGIND
jgi:hypothetical protein